MTVDEYSCASQASDPRHFRGCDGDDGALSLDRDHESAIVVHRYDLSVGCGVIDGCRLICAGLRMALNAHSQHSAVEAQEEVSCSHLDRRRLDMADIDSERTAVVVAEACPMRQETCHSRAAASVGWV